MNTSTQIDKACNWIAGLRYEDIPESVLRYASSQILNCLAAISAGSLTDTGVKIRRALLRELKGGSSTLLPYGEQCSLDAALYFHSAMVNALELDDFIFMGHVSQSAVTVPLALGEMLKANMKDVLLALIGAEEVAGRLSAYMVSGPLQGHMRSFIHRTSGAVATSMLLKLDRQQMAHAIAIALSSIEHPLFHASFSAETKVNQVGPATVEGVRSAFLASEGMKAARDIIEHPAGFFRQFSYSKSLPDIWDRLGKTWTLDTISFKQYATCAYAQGPVTAAVDLFNAHRPDPGNIERVIVHVPIVTLVMEKFSIPHEGNELTPVNCHFSTIRSVAAALLYGEIYGDFYAADSFPEKTGGIQELIDRIVLRHNWKMTIDLIRGMDRGIHNAGNPGFLGQSVAGKAFRRFKAIVGSRTLITLRDLPELFNLPWSDVRYLLRRYSRAFLANFIPGKYGRNRQRYFSFEDDLRKMDFHLGGKIEIILKDGKILSSTCTRPAGFAAAPGRNRIPEEKFSRETAAHLSKDDQDRIRHILDHPGEHHIHELTEVYRKNGN